MRKLLLLLLALPCLASAAAVHEAQYGVAHTFYFELYNTDGTLDVDEADGGAEVSISCDEGAETTATNDFVDEGTYYSITVTAAEMACGNMAVVIAATDTNVFFVNTFGDLNAFDATRGIASGVAQSGSSTSMVLASSTNIADDYLNDRVVCITAGTGAGQCRLITDWVQSTDTATLETAWDTALSTDSEYIVDNSHQSFVSVDANGVVDANVASFDTDALDSGALAATAVSEIADGLHSILKKSTCDSATSSTCVDATLTEADDYWKGAGIVFTSGDMAGKTSCVYDFTASSDTLTFWDIGTSPSTGDYVLIASPVCEAADDEGS